VNPTSLGPPWAAELFSKNCVSAWVCLDEQEYSHAVRKSEFLAGRRVAGMALKAIGCAQTDDIAILPNGAPAWPTGYVGSITHTRSFVSAVVAQNTKLCAVGYDAEERFDENTALRVSKVALRSEEFKLQQRSGLEFGEFVCLIFSAKESLYKALSPLGADFDFLNVQATDVDVDKSRIQLQLDPGITKECDFDARFLRDSTMILTSVELARV
jgi:enterobactin synthetase component D